MTKTLIPTENSKTNGQHKNATKTSITQQLRTDLGQSVGETTAIQMVWLTGLRVPNHPTYSKSCVIKRTHVLRFVNNPPYID